MMGEAKAAVALSGQPWAYADSCVVLDFTLRNESKISFDLYLKPAGWELQLFGRNKKSEGYLNTLMGEPALRTRWKTAPLVGDRHIVQTWPLHSDLGEIKDALCSWVNAVVAANHVCIKVSYGRSRRSVPPHRVRMAC